MALAILRAGRTGGARALGASAPRRMCAPGCTCPMHVRGLAGPVQVYECDTEDLPGPAEVARTDATIETGVRYEAGVPSPMESTLSIEPIVVDGTVAKTGGGPLGHPIQFIKLSAWDPTPVACNYTGLRFVSKQALENAARKAK